MRLITRLAAEHDIQEAYNWYEMQRSGLGEEFLAALTSTRNRIVEHPQGFPVVHRTVRRALLPRRFPYGILYRIDGDFIIIVACWHARRDPSQWQSRA